MNKQTNGNKKSSTNSNLNDSNSSSSASSSSTKTSKIPFLSSLSKKKSAPQQQPTSSGAPINSSNSSSNPDVSSIGSAFNNMKLGQDKDKSGISGKSEKDKDKDKKDKASKLKPSKSDEKEPKVTPFDKVILKANGFTYSADRVVGNGSFGVVVRATVVESNDVVAIKKVLQDKRYKNRELQIMQMLAHPNIVQLKNSFYSNGDKPEEVFLNLVLEFVPDTVYRVARHYSKLKQTMPLIYTKLYTYQMLRALGYIHAVGICHRDIKPQNLLLDPATSVLKLCDFGSAKMLVKGEPNVSYICSRYYRAPELIFGATNYTTAIDVWSAGCVMAELLTGQPLFPGESGVDQLVEIIKVLGTPTREEIQAMNQTYTEYKFPQIKGNPWSKLFKQRPPEAIDLVSKLLQYTPSLRLKPFEACAHPFFDELRDPNTVLPNGKPLPPLFNFTEIELKEVSPLLSKLATKAGSTTSTSTTAQSTPMATSNQ